MCIRARCHGAVCALSYITQTQRVVRGAAGLRLPSSPLIAAGRKGLRTKKCDPDPQPGLYVRYRPYKASGK